MLVERSGDALGRAGGVLLAGLLVGVAGLACAADIPPLPQVTVEALPAPTRERVAEALRQARDRPASAAATGELAMLLHAYDQLSSAAAAYERARALAPDAFEWPYLAGLVMLRLGRPAEAASGLRAAVDRQPRSVPARVGLGEALLALGAATEARALFAALVAERPDLPQAHHGLGRAAGAMGNTDLALESYRTATRLFPAYGAAQYALGLLCRDLGRTEEAEEHLRLHQRHWRDVPPLDDAVLARVLGLKQGPDEIMAEALRLAKAGDLPGAIDASEQALEQDPGLTRAQANLIALYARAERWEKVEEHYRAVPADASGRVEVDFNYGIALRQQGRAKEAKEAFERVLAASPLDAPAHNHLGMLLEGEGKLEEALEHYRRAAANAAAFRAARFNVGRVLVNLGRPLEAVPHFERILEPDDEETPRYLYALGAAWARAGDREKALRCLGDARRRAGERGQRELAAAIERDLATIGAEP